MSTEGYSSLSAFDNKVRLLGLNNSLFDTTALVEAELQMLEMQIRPKENQKKLYTQEKTAWERFKKDFGSLDKLLQDTRFHAGNEKMIAYSKENVVSVDASSNAMDGEYRFTVQSLAQRHQVAGSDMGGTDTALGLSDTVQINQTDLAITTDMTLRDIVNTVNNGTYGVTASIISNRLVLSSEQSGAANTISVTNGANNALGTLGVVNADGTFANELQQGQDAAYTVNGISLTSASNTVSNAIDGVTVNLQGISAEEVNVKIKNDKDKVVEKIKEFADGYNKAIMQLNKHTEKGAFLQGQLIPINVRNAMSSTAYYTGPNGGRLYEAGLEIDGDLKDGSLRLNETKLREMLDTDPQKVKDMFFGDAGVAKYLKDKLDPYTKETGNISTKIDGLTASIDDLTDAIERFEVTYEQQRDSLLKKYAAFETMMANLNSQMSYMEAQLKALSGSSDK